MIREARAAPARLRHQPSKRTDSGPSGCYQRRKVAPSKSLLTVNSLGSRERDEDSHVLTHAADGLPPDRPVADPSPCGPLACTTKWSPLFPFARHRVALRFAGRLPDVILVPD